MLKFIISLLIFLCANLSAQVNGTTGLPIGGLGTGAIKYNAGSGTFSASFRSPTRNGDYQPLEEAQFQIFTKRGSVIVTSDKLMAELKNGSINDDAIFPLHTVHFGEVNGVTVDMTGYVPFNPKSVNMMTHPCAMYEFILSNNQNDSVLAAIAFKIKTLAVPIATIDSGFTSNSSSLQMSLFGTMSDATGALTYGNDSGFFSTGLCNDTLSGMTNRLSMRVFLNSHETKVIRFVLAWYRTDDPDHYQYAAMWSSAEAVAVSALNNFTSFKNYDSEFVSRMRASNIPSWLVDQTLNSLVNLINNSVFFKDGRYCHTEGQWTPEGTMDQMWHARQIYTLINPDLAWQELEWWARTQHVSSDQGQIHHDVGTNFNYVGWDDAEHSDYRDISEWVDLNCGFIISVYEAFIATADRTKLDYFWPYVKKAGQRILDQVQLYGSSEYPFTFSTSLSSYDAGGNSQAYNTGLSIVTYRILSYLAGVMGDLKTADTFNDAFQKARTGFESRYLNASFPTGTYCESALGGPWIANFLKIDSCWTAKKIDILFSTISNYYDPLNKGMGYPGGSYSEWQTYLVSHLGGFALQTNRINIWSSLQKDMYERNYLNRNLVFNQQLGIQPKVTTPVVTATNVQGSNQYISIPVLWRNYYDIIGFHQNKFSGELWLEPKIVDTSGHQLQNALVITSDGYASVNYITYGESFQNQQIIFKPDNPINVSALYVWDLYADSASAITSLKVNGTSSDFSRMGTGGQSHLKINWSGTIPTSGITIVIEGIAQPGSVVPTPPKNFQCSALNPSMILLKWNAGADDVTGYIVESQIGGSFQQITKMTFSDSSYTDTGLLSSKEYVYRIRSFNTQNVSDPSTAISITTPESNNGEVLIALNAGGNAYMSASGVEYASDATSGFVSGGQTYSTTAAIANTQDAVLYQSERYGDFSYSIPLPNGSYNAVLKFAEIYQDTPGARIFSVDIEGNEVMHNIDLYFRSGKYTAYDIVVPIELKDTMMNIKFVSITDNAKLSALEICRNNASAIHGTGSKDLPKEYMLRQNYPNPFNPSTTIEFSLPSNSYVTLKVFDLVGREVATLVNTELSAGNYSRQWNTIDMSSGVYFYRLSAVPTVRRNTVSTNDRDGQNGTFTETKKLTLLR